MSIVIDLLKLARKIAKEELSIDLDRGEIKYRNHRIVMVDSSILGILWDSVYNYLMDASAVMFEVLGESLGATLNRTLNLKDMSIKDKLDFLSDLMRLSGYGILKYELSGNNVKIHVINVPINKDLLNNEGFRNALTRFIKSFTSSILNIEEHNVELVSSGEEVDVLINAGMA